MTHFFTSFCHCLPGHVGRLLFVTLALLGSLISFTARAQNLVWARSLGGTNQDQGNSVAVDGAGNVYTTGSFAGTADFDPGPGTTNLTSAGSTDIFVSKLDASGSFVWAVRMGGTGIDVGYWLAVDGSGNVYTTGYFNGTADFDPGPGTTSLTSAGSADIFVSKLDASGSFVWARSLGGTGTDVGNSVAVDGSGNVYTTGFFNGTADFDPGAGTANLTSAVNFDIFVSKLDASGSFVWARSLGGTVDDYGNSVAVDGSGNVYTTGFFGGTVDFDPGPGTTNLTSVGGKDIFVSKLDASGSFVWARSLGGTSDDTGYWLAVDGSGNVYTTGIFQGTVDFDPGPGTTNLTSAGSNDIFVSKLDASGSFVWAVRMGGTGNDVGFSVAVDGSGNVYTTGFFVGTVDFDPGTGTTNLTSAGGGDIFVSKLNTSGSFVWAVRMGGTVDDIGNSVAVDGSGNVYTTGTFRGTVDFDPGTGTTNLTSAGSDDIFLSKLGLAALPVTLAYFNGRNTPTGNLLGWQTAREDNNARFQIERSRDAVGFESIATIPSQAIDGTSLTPLTYSYLDASPLPGVTYYRLLQTDRDGTQSRSKIIALTRDTSPGTVLYPNPVGALGEVTLEPALSYRNYQLSDVLGRVVAQSPTPGTLSRLSVGTLPAGVYLLRVQTDEGPTRVFRVLR